jgi:hypothetical protein
MVEKVTPCDFLKVIHFWGNSLQSGEKCLQYYRLGLYMIKGGLHAREMQDIAKKSAQNDNLFLFLFALTVMT